MNYDKKIQVGKYEISVDTKKQYGYFEHDFYGEDDGGSFDMEDNVVTEIDGCFAIPKEVADGIIKLGFEIDKDEFCIGDE